MAKILELIDKAKFIEIRYQRYIQKNITFRELGYIVEKNKKKRRFEIFLPYIDGVIAHPPFDEELITKQLVGSHYDMDDKAPKGKNFTGKTRDMVLCDKCDLHINEAKFFRYGDFVYHNFCFRKKHPEVNPQNAVEVSEEAIRKGLEEEYQPDFDKAVALLEARKKKLSR